MKGGRHKELFSRCHPRKYFVFTYFWWQDIKPESSDQVSDWKFFLRGTDTPHPRGSIPWIIGSQCQSWSGDCLPCAGVPQSCWAGGLWVEGAALPRSPASFLHFWVLWGSWSPVSTHSTARWPKSALTKVSNRKWPGKPKSTQKAQRKEGTASNFSKGIWKRDLRGGHPADKPTGCFTVVPLIPGLGLWW